MGVGVFLWASYPCKVLPIVRVLNCGPCKKCLCNALCVVQGLGKGTKSVYNDGTVGIFSDSQ